MRKKAKTIIITVVMAVAAIAVIGWVLTNNKKKNAAKTAVIEQQASSDVFVKTFTVSKQSLEQNFAANGNFAPAQQINFAAENSGRVVRVLVDEGSRVSKGQTLAIVNANDLNVDLESAQSVLSNAVRDRQRFENAYKTGGVTQQQLDQAKLAVENAQARVSQARIRVGEANIRSSINGIVNKRYIEPGAVVSPGTQLFEIVDVSTLKLNITVNETQVANLKVGDKAQVKASVFPDKEFTGKVSFIAAKADNSLNFPIELEIENNKGNILKAGMYGTAIFNLPAQSSLMLIPRSAFIGSVNSNEIFVLENNTAKLRKVIAGRVLGDKVEVLQGINEGEIIITSGQINLSDGSKVQPIK